MTLVGYRHAAYSSPWWGSPNTRAGRFHRALEATTQYLCLHPLGPAAEVLRHHVGPDGPAAAHTVALDLWAARLPEQDAFVRLDFDTCVDHGITPEELVGDDHGPTQDVADRLRAQGVQGIVVHSAALPGTSNVVLFGPRVLHPYLLDPVIGEEVPTGHLTDAARPAAEVLPLVRWLGAPHAALQEWRATGTYAVLDDPLA
jgi:hypothetical protein